MDQLVVNVSLLLFALIVLIVGAIAGTAKAVFLIMACIIVWLYRLLSSPIGILFLCFVGVLLIRSTI